MPEPVRGTQPAPVQAPAPVSVSMSSPVAMTASPPSAGAAEPVLRRAPEPVADDWARYAVTGGRQPLPVDAEQARLAAAAAAAAPPVGLYGASGSPQHAVSAPVNGDQAGAVPPEESDTSNRNSMGFQITSITQSSAEPDADPIDESGDDDESGDTVESSRTTADGGGLTAAPGNGSVSMVDGLTGRLLLPLAGTPPSFGLTPRELTASPGVTGAEVLPVIPTIGGFGITLVPGALESVDAHGNAEIVEFPSEIEMDLMPTGLTVGVAPGSPGDDLQETWQSRFKVVKIETNVPFKRGRWQCMDYMDQPEAAGAATDGPASAASSAHSSVQMTAGEPEPPPQPAASEEASLPGLAEDPGVRWDAPRVNAVTPEPSAAAAAAAATTTGATAAQPSISVPHQTAAQSAAAGGLAPGRDASAASSAPNVHTVTADRGVTLPVGMAAPAAGLARQSSQPATPEEARLTVDGVPMFRPAEQATRLPAAGGLTLPDLLPNSSFMELVQASVADEQEGAADSTSPGSSGTVDKVEPIDNKIEQAMDLVKSHLLLAVREEVDVLKANISKLVDKISVLERENEVLKSNAPPQVLAQLDTAPSLAPSPPPPASVTAAAAVAAPPAQTAAALQPPPPPGAGLAP